MPRRRSVRLRPPPRHKDYTGCTRRTDCRPPPRTDYTGCRPKPRKDCKGCKPPPRRDCMDCTPRRRTGYTDCKLPPRRDCRPKRHTGCTGCRQRRHRDCTDCTPPRKDCTGYRLRHKGCRDCTPPPLRDEEPHNGSRHPPKSHMDCKDCKCHRDCRGCRRPRRDCTGCRPLHRGYRDCRPIRRTGCRPPQHTDYKDCTHSPRRDCTRCRTRQAAGAIRSHSQPAGYRESTSCRHRHPVRTGLQCSTASGCETTWSVYLVRFCHWPRSLETENRGWTCSDKGAWTRPHHIVTALEHRRGGA